MRNLATIREIDEDTSNPFKASTLRQWVFYGESNGFAEVIFRVGRRIYIDLDRFDRWLEEQNQAGGRREGS